MLICDTSGLLAAADSDDPRHAECVRVVERHTGQLIISVLSLAEIDHLVRRKSGGHASRLVLRGLVGGSFELATLTEPELQTAIETDEAYAALDLGVVDASLVVLAERYGTRDLLTLDERHFRAVTPLQGGAFRLLPADA